MLYRVSEVLSHYIHISESILSNTDLNQYYSRVAR